MTLGIVDVGAVIHTGLKNQKKLEELGLLNKNRAGVIPCLQNKEKQNETN